MHPDQWVMRSENENFGLMKAVWGPTTCEIESSGFEKSYNRLNLRNETLGMSLRKKLGFANVAEKGA
jgi:hypothetical protein